MTQWLCHCKGAVVHFSDKYAGDISVTDAFRRLEEIPDSILIDVRTRAEWSFVGVPDLSSLKQEPLFVEWQSLPPAPPVSDFATCVTNSLSERGLDQQATIFFLCRSGARSLSAAVVVTQVGYANCYNVADGFEGPLNQERHRGAQAGWKAAGLPWIQT